MLVSPAKNILQSLGVAAAATQIDATDTATQIYGSRIAIIIISNKEIQDIMKMVKSLEKSSLLIKCVSKIIGNEATGQQDSFHKDNKVDLSAC